MPIYAFACPQGHKIEKFKPRPYKRERKFRCSKCGLWMRRDYLAEHAPTKELHLDYKNDPISHLVKKDSFKEIRVEHLTPEPVTIRSGKQYHELLKRTHSREARS